MVNGENKRGQVGEKLLETIERTLREMETECLDLSATWLIFLGRPSGTHQG